MPSGCVSGRQALSKPTSVPGLIWRVVIQTKCSFIVASSRTGAGVAAGTAAGGDPLLRLFLVPAEPSRLATRRHAGIRVPACISQQPPDSALTAACALPPGSPGARTRPERAAARRTLTNSLKLLRQARCKGVICWWQWTVTPWLGTPGAKGKVVGFLRTAAPLAGPAGRAGSRLTNPASAGKEHQRAIHRVRLRFGARRRRDLRPRPDHRPREDPQAQEGRVQ